MTFMYACEAEGLQTCPMEGYDSRRVREALRVPDRYEVCMAVATGVGEGGEDGKGAKGGLTSRFRLEDVFFDDTFGNNHIDRVIDRGQEEEEKTTTSS